MARNETTDMVAAFVIGAALGVAATLLLKDDEPDSRGLAQALRVVRQRRRRRLRLPSRAQDGLMDKGRRAAGTLRDHAARVVAAAGKDFLDAALSGARRSRR